MITIVVGGQYGSEGKGKVTQFIAKQQNAITVRCGGPNSGHTVNHNGKDIVLRQLPAGATKNNISFISAGCVINIEVLKKEMKELGLTKQNIIIDPHAAILKEQDHIQEQTLKNSIGSTGTGNGYAMAQRLMRETNRIAQQSEELQDITQIKTVAPLIHRMIPTHNIIIEGTQGFGLSLLHGTQYPFLTSRDTTASGFASEVGIGPKHIDEVVLVIRTFPIRVGGHSGPIKNEISWEDVQEISGAKEIRREYTSVTNNMRRVAKFDRRMIQQATQYNSATQIAVMGIDRRNIKDYRKQSFQELSKQNQHWIKSIEKTTSTPVTIIGSGERTNDIFHKER